MKSLPKNNKKEKRSSVNPYNTLNLSVPSGGGSRSASPAASNVSGNGPKKRGSALGKAVGAGASSAASPSNNKSKSSSVVHKTSTSVVHKRSAAEQSRVARLGAKNAPTLSASEKVYYSGELDALKSRHCEALDELDQ